MKSGLSRLPQVLLLVVFCSHWCAAQDGGKAEGRRVKFAPGSSAAAFKGTVHDALEIDYELEAQAGQELIVRLVSGVPASAVIKVRGPGATELKLSCLVARQPEASRLGLPTSAHCYDQSPQVLRREGKTWSATLPESGNYMLSVYRPESRSGSSSYSLLIVVPPLTKPSPNQALSLADAKSLETAMRSFIASFKPTNVTKFLSHFSRTGFFYANNPLNEMRATVPYSELARDLQRKGEWYCTYLKRCDELDAFIDNIADGETWPRVGGSRFVPPGQDASSPTFVTWRKEAGRWVIDEIGYPQA